MIIKKIQRAMDDRGMTQADLCRSLNISPQVLSHWFKRGRVPLEHIKQVAAVMGLSVLDLLPGPDYGLTSIVARPRLVADQVANANRLVDAWACLSPDGQNYLLLFVEEMRKQARKHTAGTRSKIL